jgi:hypothetical protein
MAIAAGKVDSINLSILAKNLKAAYYKLGPPVSKVKDKPIATEMSADETAAAIKALMGSGAPVGMTKEKAKAAGVVETPPEAPKGLGITTAKLTLPKVALIDATAVGQKVEGTSASSTYYTVALASNFKVAARLASDKVSVRVEGSPSPAEQQQLTAMGLSKSPSGHWSTHFGIESVPVERVLGAVLMSIGAKYLRKVESAAEVAEALK